LINDVVDYFIVITARHKRVGELPHEGELAVVTGDAPIAIDDQ
jgi:hypothetical protein